jgi:Amt family ammonium transporter
MGTLTMHCLGRAHGWSRGKGMWFWAAAMLAVATVGISPSWGQDNGKADGESASEVEGDAEVAEEPATPPTLEEVATTAERGLMAGNISWMLTSSALVLFMTAPGLAMFYGGLVRRKNVLSVIMQCLFLMGMMTVVWALYGYSLAFGGAGKYVGNGEYLFMNGVQRTWDEAAGAPATPMFDVFGTPLPMYCHMLFQGMFFIITPALICGAFAERMKFNAMALFSLLWGTLVYCPLCHWVWDGGILGFSTTAAIEAGTAVGWAGGALDFAGGTVVHISSGISALLCAILLGRRKGFGTDDMRPHNLTYTAIGAGMLWVGWFGFNAGSELLSDDLTPSAFAVTHFSAAAGVLGWSVYEWLHNGKPSVLGAASGAVAGLVCITPAAGFVQPMPALAMGFLGGIVCALAVTKAKGHFGYDDSLDAFGVHGVGGTLGAILTGVFATRVCWDIDAGNKLGLIEGESRVLIGQLVAVATTWVYSLVVTFIILKVIDATIGLRVSEEGERRGLDVTDHGEEGYIFV